MNRYLFIQIGFFLLTLFCFAWLYRLMQQAIHRTSWDEKRKSRIRTRLAVSFLIWMLVVSVLSITGIMANFQIFPLNFVPVVGLALVVTVALCLFSPTTGIILDHLENHQIIQLQIFRVPVELLLWMLLLENLLPVQMSFEGRNFDILAGLTAPVMAYLSRQQKVSKGFLIAWNLVCLGLLINIVTIAILSLPSPFRYFMNEPANTIVSKFPIAFLPTFLVPLALGLHLLSLRKLIRFKM